MKTLNKVFLILAGALFLFASCEDAIVDRASSPLMPDDCLGVYFPATNVATIEMEPTQPTEMSIEISRADSTDAVDIPLTVDVNDDDVFVVPASVAFAAGQKTTTFTVTFPTAGEGTTYNLKISVVGDAYVNQYAATLPYLLTNVTRIKWSDVEQPFIYVDGTFAAFFGVPILPMYVETQKAELGSAVRYRFKNAYRVPTSKDADGIYDGYPSNDPGDFDETQDYYTIIEIDADDNVTMSPSEIGVDWDYGMFSIGSIYGNLSTNLADYPLGEVMDTIITFPSNSLYISMADYDGGGARICSTPTIIYMTKDAFLAANMKIDNFNDVEYEEMSGAVSEFKSTAYSDGWNQSISQAIDIDTENEKSEYKNLYYLSDLYAADFGLAFYYNGKSVSIPSNQYTGKKAFGKKVYVSPSDAVESKVEVNSKNVTIYTLGLKFHFEDGTLLGEFAESFYYSKNAITYSIQDFYGNYTMTAASLFGDPDTKMDVSIAAGAAQNTLVIEGIEYAETVAATFDPATSVMSIAPQALADMVTANGTYDLAWLGYTADDDVNDTSGMSFTFNMSDQLVLTAESEAIGYAINSVAAGGLVDGFYDLIFTKKPAAAKVKSDYKALLSITKKANNASLVKAKKAVKDNFVIQGKSNPKTLKR